MKKKMVICLCSVAVAATLLTACGGSEESIGGGTAETAITVTTEAVESTQAAETEGVETEESAETQVAETAEIAETPDATIDLEDGSYQVDFATDSSMFRVNEALDGMGTLTVENGVATVHISLVSQKIVNLYVGLAEAAPGDEANWLQPTVDTVNYADGTSEEVYGFDVPVPYLDGEFDLAILGTKGTWYDHRVSVSNPVLGID